MWTATLKIMTVLGLSVGSGKFLRGRFSSFAQGEAEMARIQLERVEIRPIESFDERNDLPKMNIAD